MCIRLVGTDRGILEGGVRLFDLRLQRLDFLAGLCDPFTGGFEVGFEICGFRSLLLGLGVEFRGALACGLGCRVVLLDLESLVVESLL